MVLAIFERKILINKVLTDPYCVLFWGHVQLSNDDVDERVEVGQLSSFPGGLCREGEEQP